jgi:hypothetical protein
MTMSRPRKDDALTPENVLNRMRPGDTYQANQIAAKFHLSAAEIRPLLNEMVAAGQIELSKANVKSIGFRRPRTDAPAAAAPEVATSIAGQRIATPMVGEFSGWEAEVARHRDLCMMVRRSR